MTPNPACLVPVPWHCDPKPHLADVVVSGDLSTVVIVLVIVLLALAIIYLFRRL